MKNSPLTLIFTCLLLALLAGIASTHAAETGARTQPGADQVSLVPLEVSYSASMEKGVSLQGDARRRLQKLEDGTWLYRTDVDSFIADIDETLVFRWENSRVVPLRYVYSLSGLLIKNRKQVINFDWKNQRATGHYRGEEFSLPLEQGALDPMGFQLQLRHDIKAGARDMTYRVIDKGRYDTDRFAVIDEETINAGGETVPALKAEKVRDGESKRRTLMWFAPDRDYLLVKLLQVEPDGSEYELRLDEVRFRP